MKYVSVKHASEIALKGVRIEFDYEDKTLRQVALTDADGNTVVVRRGESYAENIRVLVPQPLEPAKRFKLSGSFLGVAPITEYFEHQYDADGRRQEYASKAGRDDCGLSVSAVDVLINEDGSVAKEGGPEPARPVARQTADADIPF